MSSDVKIKSKFLMNHPRIKSETSELYEEHKTKPFHLRPSFD